MRTHKATALRFALALLVGLVVWVAYKAVWKVPLYLDAPSPVVATDWEMAGAFWGFAAVTSAGEFLAIALIAGLAWIAVRGGGPIRAALLVMIVYYLLDALVILFVLPGRIPSLEPPTWRSVVPGLRAISHLGFSAFVGALVWRIAYRRIDAQARSV